jgi:hypothetical protein
MSEKGNRRQEAMDSRNLAEEVDEAGSERRIRLMSSTFYQRKRRNHTHQAARPVACTLGVPRPWIRQSHSLSGETSKTASEPLVEATRLAETAASLCKEMPLFGTGSLAMFTSFKMVQFLSLSCRSSADVLFGSGTRRLHFLVVAIDRLNRAVN